MNIDDLAYDLYCEDCYSSFENPMFIDYDSILRKNYMNRAINIITKTRINKIKILINVINKEQVINIK